MTYIAGMMHGLFCFSYIFFSVSVSVYLFFGFFTRGQALFNKTKSKELNAGLKTKFDYPKNLFEKNS